MSTANYFINVEDVQAIQRQALLRSATGQLVVHGRAKGKISALSVSGD